MKPLSPAMHARLLAANHFVLDALKAKMPARAILDTLRHNHGARLVLCGHTNRLTCAGVTATCTWSSGAGLIDAWRKNSGLRLIMAAQS